jgi:hypothetical protein
VPSNQGGNASDPPGFHTTLYGDCAVKVYFGTLSS